MTDQAKQQQQQLMLKFATDLKSRNEGIRNKAAKDLYIYVSTELREVGQEELNTFLDDLLNFPYRYVFLCNSQKSRFVSMYLGNIH